MLALLTEPESTYPQPEDEEKRVQTLRDSGLLDTPFEEDYDRLTEMARDWLNVPIALVSLLDENRQWYKSCVGVDHRQTDRKDAICNYTITTDDPVFTVSNALEEPRFADLPAVRGEPGLRSYLGAPIYLDDQPIGTFCVLDTQPRQFTDEEQEHVQSLARQTEVVLDLRKTAEQRREESARTRRLLETTQAILDGLDEQICIVDEGGTIMNVNERWMNFGRENDADPDAIAPGANYFDASGHDILNKDHEAPNIAAGIRSVIRGDQPFLEWEYECAPPGESRWFQAIVTPLPLEEKNWAIVAHQEITRRKEARLELKTSRKQFKELSESLEERVEQQTDTIRHREEAVVLRLLSVLGYRDDETGDHVERIGDYSAVMAREWGWEPSEVRDVELAAAMHDAGKVGIPDEILQKPGELTEEEFDVMKDHTLIGAQIFEDPEIPLLRTAQKIALNHHERWDGTGYPNGREGEGIPLVAQMVSIVDVYDALTHDRVYRDAFPEEKALSIIEDGRGSHFNPEVHDLFFAVLDDLREIG